MRVAEDDESKAVPECEGMDLSVCPNHLVLNLSSGGLSRTQAPAVPHRNWLIQAKLDVLIQRETTSTINRCGLVDATATGPKAVLDQVLLRDEVGDAIALSAVVKKRAGIPTSPCAAHRSGGMNWIG